ncbi:MAG: MFS transporter, partial [Agrobacterium sp.]|nr:MFS transporter [Agrobacterium sp.]
VAHERASSVGSSLLITIAAMGSAGLTGAELTASRSTNAFETATVMLMTTLGIALLTIVPATTRRAPTETEAAPTESAA